MLHKRMTRLLAAPAAIIGFGLAAPAGAVSFDFTGTCIDCAGAGTGTLVLKNYNLGDVLTSANFVKFTYTSNLLSYSLTNVDDLIGSFPAATGPAYVSFHGGGYSFNSFVAGPLSPWCTGAIGTCGSDYGLLSSWSLVAGSVPEPAMWGAMVVGFGVLGASMRRPRRTTVLYA